MRSLIVFLTFWVTLPGLAATKDEYKEQYERLTCDAINDEVRNIRAQFVQPMNKKDELTKQYIALAELRIDKNCFSNSSTYIALYSPGLVLTLISQASESSVF